MPDRNWPSARVLKLPQELLVTLPTGHYVGRLRYDTLVNGRTHILPTWLLATSDGNVAARIAKLFRAELHLDDEGSGQHHQLLIDHAELDVLLDGPQAIQLQMLRRRGSTVVRSCDGRTQQTPFGKQPCRCPPTVMGRWQAAKAGHGCEPLVHIAFLLAADPTLGRFLLASATWRFADHAATVKATLRQHHGPVRARLSVNRTLHTTNRGTTFAYSQPRITILPKP